ncbi:NAD(P)/FAD-dependent oxidoreductase [Cereibacter sphaeroides]|uniref:NAD(P)/FAD-dependent oxidoreductase n=1 Tax=Cereibacter sphaeroides TaxID=1063 RepID=UPI001F27CEBF|nr:NAD(P)/FAD-dependent oxidoreductase [Cereibacter sphaeroides]MCE6951483.1 NAD(P)/FAD-dependent oxidoreductase [Cereibacter sphaeroides]
MRLSRRVLLSGALSTLAAPAVLGRGRARVAVVGGGAGGATVARHLAAGGAGALDVTLIEPNPVYHTCFFSNLHLGGLRPFESLAHRYDRLKAAGVTLVTDSAVAVDRAQRRLALAGGERLSWDRLVLSPGIDFVEGSVPGWTLAEAERMPHAYKAGLQTQRLRAQVDAMREGGTVCIVAPPNPYRCPPGPYERASMIAHRLSQVNPTAKILLLDPKESYSKQALFEEGWQAHYPNMIERLGPEMGGGAVEVRPDRMEVVIDGEAEAVDVCNVIPAQVAGRIAAAAGLVDDTGWVPIDPASMASLADPAVFVLGDAAAQGDMPKSASSASSQAKAVAMILLGQLAGAPVEPVRYANTCWSLIAPEDGVKVGGSYEPRPEKITSVDRFVSQTGENRATRLATWQQSLGWYAGITADMFG